MNIKSQSSMDFVVNLSLVLIFFLLVLKLLFVNLNSELSRKDSLELNSILEKVNSEIETSLRVSGDYERVFVLPEANVPYSLRILANKELVLSTSKGDLIKILSASVVSNLSNLKSSDEILLLKKNGVVGLCVYPCDGEDLFNLSDSLICKEDGVLDSCKFEFAKKFDQFLVACDEDSARLRFKAIDDNYLVFDESSSISKNGYVLFDNVDFTLNESGSWDVYIKCGGFPEFKFVSFYLPYGHFVFETMTISACSEFNDVYSCTDDDDFYLTTNFRCVGGECGDAEVWLDP